VAGLGGSFGMIGRPGAGMALGGVDKLQWRANSSLCEFRRLG